MRTDPARRRRQELPHHLRHQRRVRVLRIVAARRQLDPGHVRQSLQQRPLALRRHDPVAVAADHQHRLADRPAASAAGPRRGSSSPRRATADLRQTVAVLPVESELVRHSIGRPACPTGDPAAPAAASCRAGPASSGRIGTGPAPTAPAADRRSRLAGLPRSRPVRPGVQRR